MENQNLKYTPGPWATEEHAAKWKEIAEKSYRDAFEKADSYFDVANLVGECMQFGLMECAQGILKDYNASCNTMEWQMIRRWLLKFNEENPGVVTLFDGNLKAVIFDSMATMAQTPVD